MKLEMTDYNPLNQGRERVTEREAHFPTYCDLHLQYVLVYIFLYEVGEDNETQLKSIRIDNPITQVENLTGK